MPTAADKVHIERALLHDELETASLDWINDPELRRTTGQELNKGESRNSLARAVFIHRLGEIRDRTYENQQHRVSGPFFSSSPSSCGTRDI